MSIEGFVSVLTLLFEQKWHGMPIEPALMLDAEDLVYKLSGNHRIDLRTVICNTLQDRFRSHLVKSKQLPRPIVSHLCKVYLALSPLCKDVRRIIMDYAFGYRNQDEYRAKCLESGMCVLRRCHYLARDVFVPKMISGTLKTKLYREPCPDSWGLELLNSLLKSD